MLGTNIPWPNSGEIDIIEAINNLPSNQYALHTTPGCDLASNSAQTGTTMETDCSTPQGCVVQETKPNSFGSGFAAAGGGVVATQLDVSGIYMWFWSVSTLPILRYMIPSLFSDQISLYRYPTLLPLPPWIFPTGALQLLRIVQVHATFRNSFNLRI